MRVREGTPDALTDFVREAGHDVRNMFTVVANSAAVLARLADDARCDASIAAIERAVQTGSRLAERLQALGRLPAGEVQQTTDLKSWLDTMQPVLQAAVSPGTSISLQAFDGVGHVRVDLTGLELALLNLVRNADEAMPEGGVIAIRARPVPDAQAVELEVADTGEGIPLHLTSQVFTRAFSTRSDRPGRGLGLSQVRAFCERSGGRVDVRTAPGQGTTFTLRLPRPQPLAAHPVGAAATLMLAVDEAPAHSGRRGVDARRVRLGRTHCTGSEVLRWSGLPELANADTDGVEFAMRRVAAASSVIVEGWPLERLYCVAAGTFKLARHDVDGYEQVLGFSLRGDLLGLDALGDLRHESAAIAIEDSYVAVMPFTEFAALARRLPAFERLLHRGAGAELMRRGEAQYVMAAPSSEVRVARFLLSFARRQAQIGVSERRFRFGMTRREIASCLGVAHETVTRALATLAQCGCIRVSHRDIEIVDRRALVEIQRPTRGAERIKARVGLRRPGLRAPDAHPGAV